MTSYSLRIHDHRSFRVSRYHPYPRVRAPRHHSDLSMIPLAHLHDDPAPRPSTPPAEPLPASAAKLPPQPAALAGESDGLKVAAEERVEEGVNGGIEEDVAVERQPGLAVLGGHLLAFVTAVWRRCRGALAARKVESAA